MKYGLLEDRWKGWTFTYDDALANSHLTKEQRVSFYRRLAAELAGRSPDTLRGAAGPHQPASVVPEP
jgi:hypothetical protein